MKNTFKAKAYKLTKENAPLSLILASRHTQRFPLLWFDEKSGVNRPLRYARNQNSPFQDEQDDTAILEPIVFENGFLSVPKTNQVLQKFLDLHPGNGRIFVEINKEAEAARENEIIETEVDALIEARQLEVDQVENISRVLFQKDPARYSLQELKREILRFAKRQPEDFLKILRDPSLKMNATIQGFFDANLLTLRNKDKEIWFNTPSNKKKMMNVPYGEDPIYMASSFFISDEGVEVYKHLKELLKNK